VGMPTCPSTPTPNPPSTSPTGISSANPRRCRIGSFSADTSAKAAR